VHSRPTTAPSSASSSRRVWSTRSSSAPRAIQVAWGAEALCHSTTQIEPFVLLSVARHAAQALGPRPEAVHRGDRHRRRWRVVWADEGAPDELKLGDAVVAVNGRPLPAGGTRHGTVSALFRGGAVVTLDDQGFWDVMLQARHEAACGQAHAHDPGRRTPAAGGDADRLCRQRHGQRLRQRPRHLLAPGQPARQDSGQADAAGPRTRRVPLAGGFRHLFPGQPECHRGGAEEREA
jgi:hypothetical protein